jgi:ribulose-5-phosphate 4-epimerase/fuculose-1-phosphate aldolase
MPFEPTTPPPAMTVERMLKALRMMERQALASDGEIAAAALRMALARLAVLDAAREALAEAKEVIRIWHDTVPAHGICLPGPEAEETWRLYQESPEMKRINAALDQLGGPTDAH